MILKILKAQIFLVLFLMSGVANADAVSVTIVRRLKGVMDVLSCHCFNGATARDSSGKAISVCFKGEDPPTCDELEITGAVKEHSSNPEPPNPCSPETRQIFFVDTFKCRS